MLIQCCFFTRMLQSKDRGVVVSVIESFHDIRTYLLEVRAPTDPTLSDLVMMQIGDGARTATRMLDLE